MAYCRWSSENFVCDLYCYETVHGWVTHVATMRYAGTPPEVDWIKDHGSPAAMALFQAQCQTQRDWLATAARLPIGLSQDGQTFVDSSPEAFRDRLLWLRSLGYRFPDYVLWEIEEEIAEMAAERVAG